MTTYDVAIIGAGVVGTAIARTLSGFECSVAVIERSPDIGDATSKANTAILHTGFDCVPGTLESRLVRRGYELLAAYARDAGVAVEPTGAVLVAWNELQLEALPGLQAKAIENGGSTDEQRVRYVVKRVLSRAPTAPEQAELLALLAHEQSRFAVAGLDPAKFAGIALTKGGDPVKAAAWTAVSRVVLNLDEAITKE